MSLSPSRRAVLVALGVDRRNPARFTPPDTLGYPLARRVIAGLLGVALPEPYVQASSRPLNESSADTLAGPASGSDSNHLAHLEHDLRPGRRASGASPGWFQLPAVRRPVIVRASGGGRVIARAATPDSRAEFFLRGGVGPERYVLEVVLRDFDDLPAVVFVRYGTADGRQVLVVPLAPSEIGAPSAQVELAGMDDDQGWEALGPVPADQAAAWDADTVLASVAAAASQVTRDAWRLVSGSFGPETGQMIWEALS